MLEETSGERFRLVPIQSTGDLDRVTPLHKMAGQGVFASELQQALIEGEVDVAVHSLKDLPLRLPEEAPVTAVPPRASPADLLLLREESEGDGAPAPPGARIGTSSPRRQSQLLSQDRDLVPVDLRGNVDTRLRKLREGWVDGLVMAEAAYERLPASLFRDLEVRRLPVEAFPTAPGQGAIAVQSRAEGEAAEWAARIDDPATRQAVDAERRLLAALGGGCGMPLGVTVRGRRDGWAVDASLASTSWREEDPPRLAWCHLTTDDLDGSLTTVLDALKEPEGRRRERHPPPGQSRVLLVADSETAAAYRPVLEGAGLRVESWYPFEYEPTFARTIPPDLLEAWEGCAWFLLTSRRAAAALERLTRDAPRKGPLVGVVGPRTAAALRRRGLPVHYVSKGATAVALAEELAAVARDDDRLLYLSAEDARQDLAAGLRERGLEVSQHAVYRAKERRGGNGPGPGPLRAAVVFSPKGAAAALSTLGAGITQEWVAIGPTTAESLAGRVPGRVKVAERRTPMGVLAALEGPP
jgi:hydroxymethylbilane synthase